MSQLERMKIFVEVAKHESFTEAGKQLGITGAAVSKQVQNLENDLQIKLFNRTTRLVSLTEEGSLLYRRARYAIDTLDEAFEELCDLKTTPKGILRVTLPVSLGLQYLKTPIAEFAALYPEVTLKVQFEDRHVNLAEEEYDLALRIGHLKDSSLVAKKLAHIPIHLYTSPAYIKDNKPIKTPQDLQNHNVFEYTRNNDGHIWHYQAPDGKSGNVTLNSTFHCDSVEMMKEAALHGVGIFISPDIFVKRELENKQLTRVLNNYETIPERNLYAVFPPNRYLSSRMRLFIDYIHDYCNRVFAEV